MVAELSQDLVNKIEQAAKLITNVKQVCILTGAGISAESGIPTFRDKQTGLWAQYRAEDLATPEAFTRNPELVWSWYQWRRQLVKDKTPNYAHIALASWQQTSLQALTIITQNVDDLHEQAGSSVTHLHGQLWHNRCSQCNKPYQSSSNKDSLDDKDNNNPKNKANLTDKLIACKHCGGYVRPDIVWFGEALPVQAWQIAEDAAIHCKVFISIGTSSLVYPAAGLAQLAKQNGATIIEINPDPTPNTLVDIALTAKAGIALPLLVERLLS